MIPSNQVEKSGRMADLSKTATFLSGLAIGVVVAAVGTAYLVSYIYNTADRSTSDVEKSTFVAERPIHIVSVTIDEAELEILLGQFQKFADTNAFAIRISTVRPDDKNFLLQLWRDDVKMRAVNPFNVGTFEIGVYENGIHPIHNAYLDDLIRDLKRSLGEVESAVFSE